MMGIMYKEPLIDGLTITCVPDHIFGYELVPVKTHKKKRINKKYLKKYGYKKVIPFRLYVFANGVFCAESNYKRMIQKIKKDEKILSSIKKFNFIPDYRVPNENSTILPV